MFIQEGPIFLDDLFCDSSDTDLLECSRTVGVVTCSHSEDVWIQCTGMYVVTAGQVIGGQVTYM